MVEWYARVTPLDTGTGRHAVMVVVAVRDEHGIETGHGLGGYWEVNKEGHVEGIQNRVNHKRGTPAIHKEAGHAEPPQSCFVRNRKCFFAKRLCWRGGAWYFLLRSVSSLFWAFKLRWNIAKSATAMIILFILQILLVVNNWT